MRIGSFNVENLFERAKALDPHNRKKVAPILNAYAEINRLLEHTTYTAEDKTRIVELLRELRLGGKDDGGIYAQLRQNRGHLIKRSGSKIEVVADGRRVMDRLGRAEDGARQPGRHQHTAMVMRERLAAVKEQPGFVAVQLCIPSDAINERVIIGTWESRADWAAWHETEAFRQSRARLEAAQTKKQREWWHEVVLAEHR